MEAAPQLLVDFLAAAVAAQELLAVMRQEMLPVTAALGLLHQFPVAA